MDGEGSSESPGYRGRNKVAALSVKDIGPSFDSLPELPLLHPENMEVRNPQLGNYKIWTAKKRRREAEKKSQRNENVGEITLMPLTFSKLSGQNMDVQF